MLLRLATCHVTALMNDEMMLCCEISAASEMTWRKVLRRKKQSFVVFYSMLQC